MRVIIPNEPLRTAESPKTVQTIPMAPFIGLLNAVGKTAVEIEPKTPTEEFRGALEKIGADLTVVPTEPNLRRAQREAEAAMVRYRSEVDKYMGRREQEVLQVLSLVGEVAQTVLSRSESRGEDLELMGEKLASAGDTQSVEMLHVALTEHVSKLRTLVARMRAEDQHTASSLQVRLQLFEQRITEAEALAMTDPLTGLLNRRGLDLRKLEMGAKGQRISVLMIDVNGFKQVNDTYGHHVGDELLRALAGRLRRLLRPSDVICRWGGDEFVILMPCLLQVARQRVSLIRTRLEIPYDLQLGTASYRVNSSAAIGIAEWRPGELFEIAFEQADRLAYEDKQAGRATKAG